MVRIPGPRWRGFAAFLSVVAALWIGIEISALETADRTVRSMYLRPLADETDPTARSSASNAIVEAHASLRGVVARALSASIPTARARLSELELKLAAIEARLSYAEENARFQSCCATVAKVEARAEGIRATCAAARSTFSSCEASAMKRTSEGTILGALAGAAAGLICAASAGPGCVLIPAVFAIGGREIGSATAAPCGIQPTCSVQLEVARAGALEDLGLAALPTCIAPTRPIEPPLALAP